MVAITYIATNNQMGSPFLCDSVLVLAIIQLINYSITAGSKMYNIQAVLYKTIGINQCSSKWKKKKPNKNKKQKT